MADKEWMRLPLLEQRVQDLVKRHHAHLDGLTIAVIGRPKATKAKGKLVLARTSILSEAMLALIADEMGTVQYVIEVARDAWDTLSPAQQTACLDHELCHCLGLDEASGHPKLVGHDVEEFGQIVRRHGLWRADLELFADAVESQLKQQLLQMGARGVLSIEVSA